MHYVNAVDSGELSGQGGAGQASSQTNFSVVFLSGTDGRYQAPCLGAQPAITSQPDSRRDSEHGESKPRQQRPDSRIHAHGVR